MRKPRDAQAIEDALAEEEEEDEEDHEDVGRAAAHKFRGHGNYTGKVVAGSYAAKTLTIKWDQNPEPETYARAKARPWLL